MADFTPSKKTAQDFNNGIEYVDGIGDKTGDAVQAETINSLVESALYTQNVAEENTTALNQGIEQLTTTVNQGIQNATDIANNAVSTANEALEQINEVVGSSVLPNGDYQGMTVGKATKAIQDGNGYNISKTYAKVSDFDRLILENEYPVGGKPYLQYAGFLRPAERWAGTSWVEQKHLQGEAYTVSVANSVSVQSGEIGLLVSIQIPSNCKAFISGFVDSANATGNIMSAILGAESVSLTSRTANLSGGGTSVSLAITTSNTPQTVTLRTYGYGGGTETYRGTISALIIPQSENILWTRTA